MGSEKSISIIAAIAILLLAAATLGSFSLISHAQVEEDIDQGAEPEATNATDTEQQVVEEAEPEATNATDTE
jgi:flagellar basal body-associated protein FliL